MHFINTPDDGNIVVEERAVTIQFQSFFLRGVGFFTQVGCLFNIIAKVPSL